MNKLDERIQKLDAKTAEYLRQLDEADAPEEASDAVFTREELTERLEKATERLEYYRDLQTIMQETGASQISLTDAESRLMKMRDGFGVAYNPQTAVDSNTHLIRDYEMTNAVMDIGQLHPTMAGIRAEQPDEILSLTADKGYQQPEDMIKCLCGGIIPNVIPKDGDEIELEMDYVEAAQTDSASADPEELSRCLRAGVVPEAYKDVITEAEVKDVRYFVKDEEAASDPKLHPFGSPDEMLEKAKEGYFVRDPERNLVYCPNGSTLRQKSIRKNGGIRYTNKMACKECPLRKLCFRGRGAGKEVEFSKDTLIIPCRNLLKNEDAPVKSKKQGHYEKRRVVKLKFKPDQAQTKQRKCLSEHPFGTIKRSMGADCFLLRGKPKVDGEFALLALGYNLARATTLLGFDKMMEVMTAN